MFARASFGKWLLVAVGFFVLFYVLPAIRCTVVSRHNCCSALIDISLTNGFKEELLFRGLFLQKYTWVFAQLLRNTLQAAVFAFCSSALGYAPSALLFIAVVVFPLGLAARYLTCASLRSTALS